jgi:isopenicillin N synthase-like dioxygenase
MMLSKSMVRWAASVGNGIRGEYSVHVPADSTSVPVVDIKAFAASADEVAAAIGSACRNYGFFYVVGHGLDEKLGQRLERLSREFFAQDLEKKLAIRMERGGRAWRGYFPVGAELTLAQADQKEGLYFGAELGAEHPKVAAGVPLHGQNLFPDIPGFRETALDYMAAMTRLGHTLMEGLARSLGLEASYFADRYTRDPLILFRIFNYPTLSDAPPPGGAPGKSEWGVGEHTDYGVLTMLRQDDAGGLEVKAPSGWLDAPPIPGSFVCNIGDMLDRMTGGLYRSTPHRVRNRSGKARLSFPFFFDPNFDAEVRPIDPNAGSGADDKDTRWDGASVRDFRGTYGEYLLEKVSKVFPALGRGAPLKSGRK